MSELAQVSWGKLQETPAGPTKIDKGDIGMRSPKRTRVAESRRSTLRRLKIDSNLAAQGRIDEYEEIINRVAAGTMSSERAGREIKNLWEDHAMYLRRGGVLSLDAIERVLGELEDAKIITGSEAVAMLEEARAEKQQHAVDTASLWEQITDHLPNLAEEPVKTKKQLQKETAKVAPEKVKQIEELLRQAWFRDESIRFLLPKINDRNPVTKKAIADDVYQNFALRVWETREELAAKDIQHLRPYMQQMLLRALVDYFRRGKKEIPTEDSGIETASRVQLATKKEQQEEVQRQIHEFEINRKITAYVRGEAPTFEGKRFGHSRAAFKPNHIERFRTIILGRGAGKDYLQVGRELAAIDPEIAERYAEAFLHPEQKAKNPAFKRMMDYIDQMYLRGIRLARHELEIEDGD